MPGRTLALDLGKRRIGLAISDEMGMTAQGLQTLERKNLREDLARLKRLVFDQNVSLLLVGNPVHMDGREGIQSESARVFAEKLSSLTGIPYRMWDERWTTTEATRILRQSGASIRKRARSIDRLAAVILLESYLDSRAAASTPEGARQ